MSFARQRLGALAGTLLLLLVSGCDPKLFGPAPVDTGTSVDAGVVVRPLVTAVTEVPSDAGSDAGVAKVRDGGVRDAGVERPPMPYLASEVVRAERPALLQRDAVGVALKAHWRLAGLPAAADTPETDGAAIKGLSEAMSRVWSIELLASGRMRIDFETRGLPLMRGVALLARKKRYGHLLLWPQARAYRVMAPGTLRAALSELRADTTPLSTPAPRQLLDGSRLKLTTRQFAVRTAYGEVRIELAAVSEAGAAGPLLCRTLLEVAGVAPSSDVCLPNEVVLAASYRWGDKLDGPPAIRFEVTEIRRQLAGSVSRFAMVPRAARRETSGLPYEPLLLTDAELRALRTTGSAAPLPPEEGAPKVGIEAYNGSDRTMWLFVDGLPAATVKPWKTLPLPALRNGRYNVHWRSYLGERIGEAAERDVPARLVFGEEPDKPATAGDGVETGPAAN